VLGNSLLYGAGLTGTFWGYAIMHATYLANRTPVRRLAKTPLELALGNKPDLSRARVWGCDAFMWSAYNARGRFGAKARRMIYVGVPANSEGFLLVDPVDLSERVAYHVTLNEAMDQRRRMLSELDIEVKDRHQRLAAQVARSGGGNGEALDINHATAEELEAVIQLGDIEGFRRLFRVDDSTWDILKLNSGDDLHEAIATYHQPQNGDIDDGIDSEPSEDEEDQEQGSENSGLGGSNEPEQGSENIGLGGSNEPEQASEDFDLGTSREQDQGVDEDTDHGVGDEPQQETSSDVHFERTQDEDQAEAPTREPARQGTSTLRNMLGGIRRWLRPGRARRHHQDESTRPTTSAEDEDTQTQREPSSTEEEQRREPADLRRPTRFRGRSMPGKPVIQPLSREDRAFLDIAERRGIPMVYRQRNPKARGSYQRYEEYKTAKSIPEFINIFQSRFNETRAVALRWLHHDYERGYMIFPHHEGIGSVNYCSAETLDQIFRRRPRTTATKDFQGLLMNLSQREQTTTYDFLDKYVSSEKIALGCMLEVMAATADEEIKTIEKEPSTLKEALHGKHSHLWREAMHKEINKLQDLGCWERVPLKNIDRAAHLVRAKWVHRLKRGPSGEVTSLKCRLVAMGNTQTKGENYDWTFAPVMAYSSLRTFFAMCAQQRLHIFQADCASAYIQSEADHVIYMNQPPGFEEPGPGGEKMVLRLKKSIYGLKQSGHLWHRTLTKHLQSRGYSPLQSDVCLMMKTWTDQSGAEQKIVLGIYVDDIVAGTTRAEHKKIFLEDLGCRFEIRDESQEGEGWILAMHFKYPEARDYVSVTQTAAIESLAEKFELNNDKDAHVQMYDMPMQLGLRPEPHEGAAVPAAEFDYRSAVGSALYLAQSTRPDTSYAVMCLSRFLNHPGPHHVKAAKHLIRYLWRTRHLGLTYRRDPNFGGIHFEGFETQSTPRPGNRPGKWKTGETSHDLDPTMQKNFCDADYGGGYDGRSTSGYCFFFGGAVVRWASKLQANTALSTAESEVYAATEAAKDLLFQRVLVAELGLGNLKHPARLYEDNVAAIELGSSLRTRSKAKHYVLRLRFLQERVENREIAFVHCPTNEMVADALTKQLPREQFLLLRSRMLGRPP